MPEGRIRKMTDKDVPMVHAIEMVVMPTPWSEKVFYDCLASGYQGSVLELVDGVVGYVMMTHKLDECHLLNICVLPSLQQQGLGQQLLTHVIAIATEQQSRKIFLEVRRSNKPAINLYRKNKFMEVGVRKNYYPLPENQYEDALLFILPLNSST